LGQGKKLKNEARTKKVLKKKKKKRRGPSWKGMNGLPIPSREGGKEKTRGALGKGPKDKLSRGRERGRSTDNIYPED